MRRDDRFPLYANPTAMTAGDFRRAMDAHDRRVQAARAAGSAIGATFAEFLPFDWSAHPAPIGPHLPKARAASGR